MSKRIGKSCKVAIGAAKVAGMGDWALAGITADQLETSEFGDNWKTYEFGMKDGGTVSFNGFLDPDDTTGQQTLMEANLENTDLTNLRLYVDNTSYYEPCQTTGYFSPANMTSADTRVSVVNVVSFDIKSNKSGMVEVSFSGKISGVMVLI